MSNLSTNNLSVANVNTNYSMTWEESVEWLRRQPDQDQLVRFCYYDDPLIDAAERYNRSEEWQSVKHFLPKQPGKVLDLGAGRGISSYAFAKLGWEVFALEPDPSSLIGTGAIKKLADSCNLRIQIVSTNVDDFPFADASFDLVYGRQVLHHAPNLNHFMKEAARVLKRDGQLIATREPVLTSESDLPEFLNNHPLHNFYGGEHAYVLDEYIRAISESFRLDKVLAPYDSVINSFPISESELDRLRVESLTTSALLKRVAMKILRTEPTVFGKLVRKSANRILNERDSTPGRNYSFMATNSKN